MAGATVLGPCRCPVCASERASARLSNKGLAYVVCDACQTQVFARSGKSDELLRSRIVAAPPAPEAKPAEQPKPAPAAAPVAKGLFPW